MSQHTSELKDSSSPFALHSSPVSLTALYHQTLLRRGFKSDPSQEAAVARLQQLFDEFIAYKAKRNTYLKKMIIYPDLPRGVYLWGGVGRGKSFLMDLFYSCVPLVKKARVHFHHFMRDVHHELQTLKGEEDPLQIVAERIAKKNRLICFDEFHVSDIGDAMILGRLLEALFNNRVMFCMTSNYHPDQLYPHGLQRANFLPAIALIKDKLDVIEVEGGMDYRSRAMETMQVYYTPLQETTKQLAKTFEQIAEVPDESGKLMINDRNIHYIRRAGGVIWCSFKELCETNRSQNDYLELARQFHTVLLSEVPHMTPSKADSARRFTWLIDIFYDQKIKLIVTAEVPPERLYQEGLNKAEFARTVSRLWEMQTRDYLSASHIRN